MIIVALYLNFHLIVYHDVLVQNKNNYILALHINRQLMGKVYIMYVKMIDSSSNAV